VTRWPVWEVELRLSSPSALARMMRAGQRPQPGLLLPTIELVVTILDDHWWGNAARLPDENP
jgi:hypothetical protein